MLFISILAVAVEVRGQELLLITLSVIPTTRNNHFLLKQNKANTLIINKILLRYAR